MVGDFNVTRFLEEKSGEGRLNVGMRRFLDIIEMNLRDLPLQGGPFTWIPGGGGLCGAGG